MKTLIVIFAIFFVSSYSQSKDLTADCCDLNSEQSTISSSFCDDKPNCDGTSSTKKNSSCSDNGNTAGITDDDLKCPVSGETISGEGFKYTYLGKEYTFCCKGCVSEFKTEPILYIKEELKCPVRGETASKDVSTVVDGVKYYFCCPPCVEKFTADVSKYITPDTKTEKEETIKLETSESPDAEKEEIQKLEPPVTPDTPEKSDTDSKE
ncbi:MAG: YHS domain protein [Chlorobi bacterium OLB4]|jgi:YHS domain.|nr:MAG: YHS domain protein [Chlorobi bacterium OLB4]MBW7855114.1 YHS domain-containing protein [Ignavibacteria bacterium]OQY76699.1 MAG: hypothetical protein B6D43_08715 [Ignavibacteriales bacterium UTCHB1]